MEVQFESAVQAKLDREEAFARLHERIDARRNDPA